MSQTIPDMEAILAEMRESFLETANEKIERLNEILHLFQTGQSENLELIDDFRREIHSLKGMGGTFQMILVTKLCHAFENFIEDENIFDDKLIEDSQKYVDQLVKLIESNEASSEEFLSKWLEGLPVKGERTVPETDNLNHIVIAASSSELTEIIKSNFILDGYQENSSTDPFEAFKIAMMKKASIIIMSKDFDQFNGADLIRSMMASKKLSKSKFAMICADRREALKENLVGVHLLSEKNIEVDILNFLAITLEG